MVKNIGKLDRIIRFSLGIIFSGLGLYYQSGLFLLLGVFSIFEAIFSLCVLYLLLGINTCPVSDREAIPIKSYLTLFAQGVFIFLVAVVLNILAKSINWTTWNDFLQSPSADLNIDNYVFLFFVYPLSFGISSRIGAKFFNSPNKINKKLLLSLSVLIIIITLVGFTLYTFTTKTSLSEKTAIESIKEKFPEFTEYPNDLLAPKSIKTEKSFNGWYIAFIQEGSGLPILDAHCYFINNRNDISEIKYTKVSGALVSNFSAKECK